ncbi:nucleotidyltransferase domain-containing protein [candidate division WOR-3 bacterium]|nr:nucleotidyltransferase domain-containing protein [candidate division WOR-3 bacterium]
MEKGLGKIIKRIVEEVDPDKIILFGSRARSENKKWSDYDICVLKKDVEHRRKLAQQIYRKLFGVDASVDVIVETPEKFDKLKDKWFLVYSEIAKYGETVYEKGKQNN